MCYKQPKTALWLGLTGARAVPTAFAAGRAVAPNPPDGENPKGLRGR